MTTTTGPAEAAGVTPIRRSPLAAVHERLGARWVAERSHWPASYGSPEGEGETVRAAAGLADVGPLVKLSVSGPDIRVSLGRIGLGGEVGGITAGTLAGVSVGAWHIAPDEALIVYEPTDPADPAAATAGIAPLRSAGFVPVEQSSGIAALVLVGPAAREVLRDVFPIDVHPRALADRYLASGPVAGIRTVVGRVDRDALPSFTLLVARDLAVALWEALLEAGGGHGLRCVGADALPGGSR